MAKCKTKKQRYPTRRQANNAAQMLHRRGKYRYNSAYWCRFCKGYHLTRGWRYTNNLIDIARERDKQLRKEHKK